MIQSALLQASICLSMWVDMSILHPAGEHGILFYLFDCLNRGPLLLILLNIWKYLYLLRQLISLAINCYRFAHSAEAFSCIGLRPQASWRRVSRFVERQSRGSQTHLRGIRWLLRAFRSLATGVGDVQKLPRASQTRPRPPLSVLDMFSSLLERLGDVQACRGQL